MSMDDNVHSYKYIYLATSYGGKKTMMAET